MQVQSSSHLDSIIAGHLLRPCLVSLFLSFLSVMRAACSCSEGRLFGPCPLSWFLSFVRAAYPCLAGRLFRPWFHQQMLSWRSAVPGHMGRRRARELCEMCCLHRLSLKSFPSAGKCRQVCLPPTCPKLPPLMLPCPWFIGQALLPSDLKFNML